MTIEQGAAATGVRIRTPLREWMLLGVVGVSWLAAAAFDMAMESSWSTFHLVLGCVFVAEALWIRTFGVDRTPESAIVRGLRRQSIPWQQVQAVVRHDQLGAGRVSLILESGRKVTLRAPTTFFGFGGAQYEQDFNRIGHWWLAHRGESWRPVCPEAPRLPVQD
jgi:hypothetical protein